MSIPKAKLFLYKSKCRTDSQGRPLWVKCDNEAACLQMAKNGFEVKMIEFDSVVPRPKYQGDFEIEGVGFGARRKKKQNKRQRKLARREHRMQHEASDGIISIVHHGDKKGRQTQKRQRGRRRH